MTAQKHIFWEALILTIFVFAFGILMGYLLESNRTSKILEAYQQSDLNLLDIKIQDSIFSLKDFNCELATKETINFADRVYEEAKILDRFEDSATLSEGIIMQHKKYDLLRTSLWVNTIKIKKECEENFHTIIYFYNYRTEDLDTSSTQNVFSKYLSELKKEYGNKIILISIAGNMDINSINFLKSTYNIDSLPMILVDEEHKISSLDDLDKIKEYLG